jgi:hypothetical protein
VSAKIHRIKLTEDERQELEVLRDRGKGGAVRVKRAVALLLSDEGPHGPAWTDEQIMSVTGMSRSTLGRLRAWCCETGPLGALERKPRDKPAREIKITGEVEARITQLACSKPPAGHARRTLRLLANHLVEIGVIEKVFVSEEGRRTARDFANFPDHLAKTVLPEAPRIVLVIDNLNTHRAASLYETFSPEKARELCERFEFHYTPRHGSWLNMAEIEIGLLARTCLERRIGSREEFCSEPRAYLEWKIRDPRPNRWQFTNEQARLKLKSLYPSV